MDQNRIPWSESYREVTPVGEIYVVDDDKDMLEILESTLTAQGFPVKIFEDADAFLRAAGERVPICIFLDVVMPGRSGLEVLKELRAQRYSALVFLTSARDDIPTVVEAMKTALTIISKSRLIRMRWCRGSLTRSRYGCVGWKRETSWIFKRTRTANGFV